MPKNKLVLSNWNTEKIKKLLNSNSSYKEGMKLFAVYLVSKGWSARKLEDLFDVSFKQITTWIHDFDKEGEKGLKDKPKPGRQSKLLPSQKHKLKLILVNESPNDYGINSNRWKGTNIIELIDKVFGIKYKKAQIYNIINSLDIRFIDGKWSENINEY